MTRASSFSVGGQPGKFKKCFTCLNMLQFKRFAIDRKVKDGRAEICFECVKNITGRTSNRGKKKKMTATEQARRERMKFARHVWLFPGGFTFPRAEMFRPGMTLMKVFEASCTNKLRTNRKV